MLYRRGFPEKTMHPLNLECPCPQLIPYPRLIRPGKRLLLQCLVPDRWMGRRVRQCPLLPKLVLQGLVLSKLVLPMLVLPKLVPFCCLVFAIDYCSRSRERRVGLFGLRQPCRNGSRIVGCRRLPEGRQEEFGGRLVERTLSGAYFSLKLQS
ncbi:MAG: hypothetical protein ACD_75C02428G0005 [uncultured bacterium]|nr:MAG: hypothetical protein ACD_75C02428G0005 [uncultured bacterium]